MIFSVKMKYNLNDRILFTEELFNPNLAYSFSKGLVIAINSLYLEIGDKWEFEDYVLEVIDYFPIKCTTAVYPEHSLIQLTLF